jgi:hypothetical protein
MDGSMRARKKRPVGLALALAVVAVVTVSLLLCFSCGVSDVADTDSENPPGIEGEVKADTSNGTVPLPEGRNTPSLLDLPGVVPASGDFDVNSVQNDVNIELVEGDDKFSAIVEAIRVGDPTFDPEGYKAFVHLGTSDRTSGNVWVTLYIGDIKTSSSCLVYIKGGTIQFVQAVGIYHPDPAEVEQAVKLRSDFESSAAGRTAIERTKAAMWPAASTATPDEYSEEYYFDFRGGGLYLYITDDRRQDGIIVAKQEKIDCLEVLGR